MINVSRKYFNESVRREAWQRLEREIDSGGILENTIKKFFSPKEIVMIEKRLAILLMLEKRKSYLDIRRLLDVSPGTISYIKQGFKRKKRMSKPSIGYKAKSKKYKGGIGKFPRYKGSRGLGLTDW